MAKQKQRALERISGEELELLRTYTYEEPAIPDGGHRAAVRALLVAGLLEKNTGGGGEVRCTERGTEQAQPLTVNELRRIMRGMKKPMPRLHEARALELELDVATRIAAEVAYDDPDCDVQLVVAEFFKLRRSRARVLA